MTNDELADLLEEAARKLRKQEATSRRKGGVALPDLLTDVELAKRLSISIRHVHALKERRAIPYVKLGRSIRFNPEKIAEALERMTVSPKRTSPARA